MEIKRIMQMLMNFEKGIEVPDIKLKTKDFSDDEIMQVEKLEYIDCVGTTSWGDSIYMINESGLEFISRYK